MGFFDYDSGTFITLMNARETDFQIENLESATETKLFTYVEPRRLHWKQKEDLSKRFVASNKEK